MTNDKNNHPLTETRASELWDAHVPPLLNFQVWISSYWNDILSALRATYDAGSAEWKANAEAAAVRAERAEDRLVDSVHVDEAALRVEAAREQGWDDAADWSIHNINDIDAERIRAANPHRPAPTLPTEDGAVIVPADGHDCVKAGAEDYYHLTYNRAIDWWVGANMSTSTAELVDAHEITPGTWKVAVQ